MLLVRWPKKENKKNKLVSTKSKLRQNMASILKVSTIFFRLREREREKKKGNNIFNLQPGSDTKIDQKGLGLLWILLTDINVWSSGIKHVGVTKDNPPYPSPDVSSISSPGIR